MCGKSDQTYRGDIRLVYPIAMLSLSTARQLKEAGLVWIPAIHDFFAIPDRGMDERVFVIADMLVNVELLQGQPLATFHGVVEWALDHILMAELIWLPTEAQLRQALAQYLQAEPLLEDRTQPVLRLSSAPEGHLCEIRFQGQSLSFEALEACEAYAAALLHVLKS